VLKIKKKIRRQKVKSESDSVTTSIAVGLTAREDPGLPAEEVNN